MIRRTLVSIAIGLLLFESVGIDAQVQANPLSLEAFFVDPPKQDIPTRLWLKVTNRTPRAQILCRPSWGYTWLSDDSQEQPAIYAEEYPRMR